MRFRLSDSATTCHALNPFGVSRIGPSGPITGTQVRPLATVACSEKLGGWPQNTEGNAQKFFVRLSNGPEVARWRATWPFYNETTVNRRTCAPYGVRNFTTRGGHRRTSLSSV